MDRSSCSFEQVKLIPPATGGLQGLGLRIRHFGLFASRRRGRMLARCRVLLGLEGCATDPEITPQLRCPVCTGPMLIIDRMTSSEPYFRSGVTLTDLMRCGIDSS